MLEKIHPEKNSQKPVKLVNDINNSNISLFACGILYKKKTLHVCFFPWTKSVQRSQIHMKVKQPDQPATFLLFKTHWYSCEHPSNNVEV